MPLKERALLYLPVVHVAPTTVPVRLFPETSAMVVPEPSLKLQAATNPVDCATDGVQRLDRASAIPSAMVAITLHEAPFTAVTGTPTGRHVRGGDRCPRSGGTTTDCVPRKSGAGRNRAAISG